MRKQIVITGMGTVTAIAHDVDTFWKELLKGTCGVDRITRFDPSNIGTQIAAEVKDLNLEKHISMREARTMDFFTRYACYASFEALQSASLEIGKNIDSHRIGVITGNGIGGIPCYEQALLAFDKGGPKVVSPYTVPTMISNMAAGRLSILHNIQGPVSNVVTACAAGTDALIAACQLLELDHCDAVLAGGTEGSISDFCISGFNALKALSTRNDTPKEASSPFDRDRDGFVMGEGAGFLVLETLEHALKRGAPIYAQIIGYGSFGDAHHITSPHPQGLGIIRSMETAIAMAGIEKTQVDYINAHGTSTPINDPIETKAVKTVFGDHAYHLKMSSIKGHIGHTIAGAGATEAIACALALKEQKLPPTANLKNPDLKAGCDLNYIPLKSIESKVHYALSNSLGFGGHNSSILFKKY